MNNKYFLFLDKKIKISDCIESTEGEGKYDIYIDMDDLQMPWCDTVFEDKVNGHYEYTLGRYMGGMWETYLFFTSDKRLIIEEES